MYNNRHDVNIIDAQLDFAKRLEVRRWFRGSIWRTGRTEYGEYVGEGRGRGGGLYALRLKFFACPETIIISCIMKRCR